METNTPVVELLRVSTADQGEDDRAGLARQEEANRRTVQRHQLKVIHQIRLIDVSGTAIASTPEIQEMIGMLRSRQARGIVAADFDRLLRPDDFRSLAILQDIKEAGACIYLPDSILDLDTQSGFLMSGLHSVIAGNELAQIKKRMLGAKEEKRRQGRHPNNHLSLPLGVSYDRENNKYFYNEEADRVKDLFKNFHTDHIHNKAELERMTGIEQRTVANLLRNELYIGFRSYTQKRSTEKRIQADGRQADKKKIPRTDTETIRIKVIEIPLIPESIFWDTQEILSKIKGSFTERRKNASELFLFKGLLFCAKCNSPMYTVPGGKAGPAKDYYYCRNLNHRYMTSNGGKVCDAHYLNRKIVEEFVTMFTTNHLAKREYLQNVLESMFHNGVNAQQQRDKQEITKRISTLDKRRGRLIDLFTDGGIDRQEYENRIAKVNGEKRLMTNRLSTLETLQPVPDVADMERIAEELAYAFSLFPFWSFEEKKEFLRSQHPKFWINERNVLKFELPLSVQKIGNHMGRGSWRQPA